MMSKKIFCDDSFLLKGKNVWKTKWELKTTRATRYHRSSDFSSSWICISSSSNATIRLTSVPRGIWSAVSINWLIHISSKLHFSIRYSSMRSALSTRGALHRFRNLFFNVIIFTLIIHSAWTERREVARIRCALKMWIQPNSRININDPEALWFWFYFHFVFFLVSRQ